MTQKNKKYFVMEMQEQGTRHKVMKDILPEIAVLTNITPQHLGYFGTMENYTNAVGERFSQLSSESGGVAVLNLDDPYFQKILSKADKRAAVLTYSLRDPSADFFADNITFTLDGMTFSCWYQEQSYTVKSKLIGEYNVYNILAAIAATSQTGLSMDKIIEAVSTFESVPGRFERIYHPKRTVFVDFAHTYNGIKCSLTTAREIANQQGGKVIAVQGFSDGCQALHRTKMAKSIAQYSDQVIFTELASYKRKAIDTIKQSLIGLNLSGFNHYQIIESRKEAIQNAIEMATEKDVVMILGRGQMKRMAKGEWHVYFDDREVARDVLKKIK